MSCPVTLNGLAKDCANGMGGVSRFLCINHADLRDMIVYQDQVVWIEFAEGTRFLQYVLPPEGGSLTSEWNADKTANIRYLRVQLDAFFPRMTTAKKVELEALAAAELALLVKDMKGKWWLLGKDRPVRMLSLAAGTGPGRDDRNGYNLSLETIADALPYEVPADVVERLSKDYNIDFNIDFTTFSQE